MKRLNIRLPTWLKILVCLMLGITVLVFLAKIQDLYRIYTNNPELVRALELGERMVSGDMVGEECSYVDFDRFPELKQKGFFNLGAPDHIEKTKKYFETVSSDINCIENAQLMGTEYKYGHATATYICQKEGVITEFTWTDFYDSCSYAQYLKSWNLPEGKYSLLSTNRP